MLINIAKIINRDVGSISRELKRNKSRRDKDYVPIEAHDNVTKRAIKQRTEAPVKNPEIYLLIKSCNRRKQLQIQKIQILKRDTCCTSC